MRVPMDLCHAPRAPTGLVPDRVISFLKVNAILKDEPLTYLSLPVSVPANSFELFPMLFSDTCVWPAFWPSHRADHTCMLGSGIPFVTFQIVFSVSLFFCALAVGVAESEAGQCSRLVSPPLPAGVGCRQGSAPTTRLITLFSLFGKTANASLVWAGTPARPGVALRNIIARFKVHSLCTQPGIRCTDPGRETLIHNSRFVPYATWHPMIVTLVFNRPLAGIDHTTASFPCHSVTVLP